MTQLLIMHERQDQFDNKLSVLEHKQEALNNRVSEVEDAVAKVADLQSLATNKSLDRSCNDISNLYFETG